MWNDKKGAKARARRGGVGRVVGRLMLLLAMLVVAAGLGLAALLFLAEAPGPLEQRKVVLVERGASSSRIAAQMEREGVVASRHLMLAYLAWQRLMGDGRPLKAGEYAIPPGATLVEVLEILRQGRAVQYRLTIPEGFSNAQALARVRRHPGLEGELTLEPEEGTLLPDTYLFSRGETRDQLVRRMMAAQRRLLEELWPKRQPGLPLKTPREAVILASIVEKETAVPEERRRIAAVFINRLRKGMRLQADPTVIYGITKGLPLGRPLSKKDLREAHPWNTYVIRGLPPTPIANPGRESIAAVLDPLKTDELYFVADGSGRHLFASDLATHNRNVQRLRAIERQRRAQQRQQRQGRRQQEPVAARQEPQQAALAVPAVPGGVAAQASPQMAPAAVPLPRPRPPRP